MPCEKHAMYVLLAQLSGDLVLGHGVSHSEKASPERSQRVPSHQLSDHISQTPGIHLVAEIASHLLEDPTDSFQYRTDRALKQCT